MDISINSLTKIYGNRTVLDIGSLSLARGKIYGIIGPNGAGKSTMLRIIAGLEEPTLGKIFYSNKLLDDKIIKNITYMSQKPYLLRRSVFNNIAYPLKLRKYDKKVIDKKVLDIMKEFKVFDLRDQLATSLSGG